jgi:hypothetical protein
MFVISVNSQKPQEALNLIVIEGRKRALFYIPLFKFSDNLLKVLVQITNEIGLQKNVLMKIFQNNFRHDTPKSGVYWIA